jgi:hypothetical protein
MQIPATPKPEHPMRKAIAIIVLTAGLAACGVVSTLMDGFKYANAVAEDLEQSTGLKPQVGFNFNNGRLLLVTVTYPRLIDTRPVRELADAARAAVKKEFPQTPENIVLSFALGRGADKAQAE